MRESLVEIWQTFVAHLPQLSAGALLLFGVALFTWTTRRLLKRMLQRTKLRRSLQELFGRLIYISIWVLGLLAAAMVVFPGLTPSKALSGLGIASVAIGFAFKDIFENFFAGVLILWRFPFDNGDFIESGDIMGRVEEITIRNTLIRRPTGELVVVPNSRLFTEPVEVLTSGSERRVSIICGIAYAEDADRALEVIGSALEGCSTLAAGKETEVLAHEFGSSSVDIEVTWWTHPEPGRIRASKSEVVTAIKRALDSEGIEIPFPYRTLTFKDPLVLAQGASGKDTSTDAERADGDDPNPD